MKKSFIDSWLIPTTPIDKAYNFGYDCGKNGANTTNCNFSIFSTPENTKAWERGKAKAEEEKLNLK